MPSILQLVQALSTRVQEDYGALPVASVLQLVQAPLNVSSPLSTRVRTTDVHYLCRRCCSCCRRKRTQCSLRRLKKYGIYAALVNPCKKANAKYNAPIAILARRNDAVLHNSSTRPRRNRPPVHSIFNLDDQYNPRRRRKSWLDSLFQTSKFDSPVFVDSPAAAPVCTFPLRSLLKDSRCARRAVDDVSMTYWRI